MIECTLVNLNELVLFFNTKLQIVSNTYLPTIEAIYGSTDKIT